MKIKPENFNKLKNAIEGILTKNPNMLQHYQELGYSTMRYRWDLYHAVNINNYMGANLYKYLNDDNIDSALRKITGTK